MTRSYRLTVQAIVLSVLLLFLLSTLLSLQQETALAAAAAATRARAVQGVLPGGAFAQIWLGLEPEFADAQITVLAQWDRLLPADNGLNFFIFDEQQLRRLGEGNNSFSSLALAAGSPSFELSTPENVIGAGFRATGWAAYTLVVINESTQGATFTLRVTNGFITDVANQVTVLDPPAPAAPPPFKPTPPALTPTPTITVTPFTTPTTFSPPIPTATVTATATLTATLSPPQSTTVRPAVRTSLGRSKQQPTLQGTLRTPTGQQLLRLQPLKANSQLLLRLAVDRAASAPPEQAAGLNFWVFDEAGFSQYLIGADPTTLAITTGKAVFRSVSDERVAGFRAVDTAPYVVVIYSRNAALPISYTLQIEGAEILEKVYLP